jgi:hypothetical protein
VKRVRPRGSSCGGSGAWTPDGEGMRAAFRDDERALARLGRVMPYAGQARR